jgi:hypothetical protein
MAIRVIASPDADISLVLVERSGLHQFAVLAVPLPLTGQLSMVVLTDRLQMPIDEIVFPLAGVLTVGIFANAGHRGVLEALGDDAVFQVAFLVAVARIAVHVHDVT